MSASLVSSLFLLFALALLQSFHVSACGEIGGEIRGTVLPPSRSGKDRKAGDNILGELPYLHYCHPHPRDPPSNGLRGCSLAPAMLAGGLAAWPMQHKAAIAPAVQENFSRKRGGRREVTGSVPGLAWA